MINWNGLIVGLSSITLGLIGLVVKSNVKDDSKNSLTSAQLKWGTYSLLAAGVFLVFWSILSEE